MARKKETKPRPNATYTSEENIRKIDAVIEEIREGNDIKKACRNNNLSSKNFENWRYRNEDIRERVDDALQEWESVLNTKIERSLVQCALGGFEQVETKIEYEPTADGKPKIKKQITTKKVLAPNVPALIFLATNRMPNKYNNRAYMELKGDVKNEVTTDKDLLNIPDDLMERVVNAIKEPKKGK